MNPSAFSLHRVAEQTHAQIPLQAVILAGGSGTRLWPLSREHFPKQLIDLLGDESLLQSTARRLDALQAARPVADEVFVVCGEEHRFTTAEQLRSVGRKCRIILEPVGRSTAPALTSAALALAAGGSDAVMVVMPADHAILDETAFAETVAVAADYAAEGAVVTMGIVPTRADTGYGYIKVGAKAGEGGGYRLERFVEKPAKSLAETYVQSGEFWWNSGIFVLRASVWLNLIEQFRPLIADTARRAFATAKSDRDFLRLGEAEFTACPS